MRVFSPTGRLRRGFFALALCWPLWAQAAPPAFPTLDIPDNFGVNIHFTHPAPGEMELLAASGMRWVRMDLIWDLVEKEPGVYDFASYDHLVESLEKHGLKALFILDYGNPHYDGSLAPHTDEGRRAFARFAVAAAKRYAGKGYLWEVWNEPNHKNFWAPKPKVSDYIRLMKEVGPTFRKALPGEMLIGPAASKVPFGFLERCFKAGLLEYWSAVTVHPYRRWRHPETTDKDYRRLRGLLAKYAPEGRNIPILSGEWGYSTAQFGISLDKQAKYLPRMWLHNLAAGLPLSIWYDWKDDGPDPKEKEHNFGMVYADLRLKPTYVAAQTLNRALDGFRLEKRLPVGGTRDYVLQFRKGEEVRFAAWTSSPRPKTLVLKNVSGTYSIVDYLGEHLGLRSGDDKGLALHVDDTPRYLIPR